MANTWENIQARLNWFLSDSGTKLTWSEAERIDAWNMAQDVFVSHTAMEKYSKNILVNQEKANTVPATYNTNPVAIAPTIGWFILPDDYYAMGQLYDPNLRKALAPYKMQNAEMRVIQVPIEYWIWGGMLHIEGTPTPGYLDMFYYAFWPKVTYSLVNGSVQITSNAISVPPWAELPLTHLAAAILFQPQAITAAMSNEFKIRIDSGTPLDNPRAQQAQVHWQWYNQLLSVHPAQSRLAGLTNMAKR